MAKFTVTKALVVAALVCLAVDNASPATVANNGDADDGEVDLTSQQQTPSPPQPSLIDRVSGVMHSVKQQADETLDGAGNGAASVLNRLKPASSSSSAAAAAAAANKTSEAGGIGTRITENKLTAEDALGRIQQTKGRTVIAAKKVMEETMHKIQSTVEGIKRTITGDDQDDTGGDRRVSNALDSLLRAVGSEGKAAFEFASDVVNETAERAKASVDRARQDKLRRLQH